MADLDDFFAKKDRKRQKARSKGGAAQGSEDGVSVSQGASLSTSTPAAAATATQPNDGEGAGAGGSGVEGQGALAQAPAQPQPQLHQQQQPEEEEWREAEVAKKADYSGLKLQHLAPGEAPPHHHNHHHNQGHELGAQGQGGGGPGGAGGGGASGANNANNKGPWNKAQTEVVEVKEVEREPPPPSEVILPPPPSSNAYVPPLLRNRPAGYMDGPPMRNKHGKQTAPDIHSEEFFPVLGGEVRRPQAKSGGGHWSEASRGAPPSSRPPPREVSLGNRYNSLTNDS